MADAATVDIEVEPKSSKMPLILGLVFLLLGGGGGFYATWSGLILSGESTEKKVEEHADKNNKASSVKFVSIEPITVSLSQNSAQKHLRFRAELEVPSEHASDVESILPRVIDVLNSYLRAIEPSDIQDPSALTRLRSQMLRRVQVVAGPGHINDLLIMEFVLN